MASSPGEIANARSVEPKVISSPRRSLMQAQQCTHAADPHQCGRPRASMSGAMLPHFHAPTCEWHRCRRSRCMACRRVFPLPREGRPLSPKHVCCDRRQEPQQSALPKRDRGVVMRGARNGKCSLHMLYAAVVARQFSSIRRYQVEFRQHFVPGLQKRSARYCCSDDIVFARNAVPLEPRCNGSCRPGNKNSTRQE